MKEKVLMILMGLFLSVSFSLANGQMEVAPDAKIILERTPCYGTCPVYQFTIYADGKIEFDGKQFVSAMGHHEKSISPQKVTIIFSKIESIHFFNLEGNYACFGMTDASSASITVTKKGKTKKINHYHGCLSADKKELADLTRLEDDIDKLAEIADWLKYEIGQ